jgi:hypothetical protein
MEGRALTMDSTWGSPGTVSAFGGSGPWRAFRTYAQTHSYPKRSTHRRSDRREADRLVLLEERRGSRMQQADEVPRDDCRQYVISLPNVRPPKE